MAKLKNALNVGALSVLLRAFERSRTVVVRRVRREGHSRRAVAVTSDFGVAPSFPPIR